MSAADGLVSALNSAAEFESIFRYRNRIDRLLFHLMVDAQFEDHGIIAP